MDANIKKIAYELYKADWTNVHITNKEKLYLFEYFK